MNCRWERVDLIVLVGISFELNFVQEEIFTNGRKERLEKFIVKLTNFQSPSNRS